MGGDVPHPDSLEAWELKHGPELDEFGRQARAKLEGVVAKYVEDVEGLMSGNEYLDRRYMEKRIDALLDWVLGDMGPVLDQVGRPKGGSIA